MHTDHYSPSRGAVLVTGASKGIGLATSRRLRRRGWRVYGGVRTAADAAALKAQRIEPVTLDITDPVAIARVASDLAAAEPGGLAGLVNNAGIAVPSPLEYLPMDELRRQLEVNVVAQLAVTQAVLPQIRLARGRIINIGSVGGRVVSPITVAYSMSKFALRAMTDGLRLELAQFGVRVVLIEPGAIKTPIWQTTLDTGERLLARLPPEVLARYGRQIEHARAQARRQSVGGADPDIVARTVQIALCHPRPKARYLVGRDARIAAWFALLPDSLKDRILGGSSNPLYSDRAPKGPPSLLGVARNSR